MILITEICGNVSIILPPTSETIFSISAPGLILTRTSCSTNSVIPPKLGELVDSSSVLSVLGITPFKKLQPTNKRQIITNITIVLLENIFLLTFYTPFLKNNISNQVVSFRLSSKFKGAI